MQSKLQFGASGPRSVWSCVCVCVVIAVLPLLLWRELVACVCFCISSAFNIILLFSSLVLVRELALLPPDIFVVISHGNK